jgi:hypothetical protein
MGCLPTPKINPPAATPAPAAQGADALKVGAPDPSTTNPRSGGAVGRLALRVGRGSGNATQ